MANMDWADGLAEKPPGKQWQTLTRQFMILRDHILIKMNCSKPGTNTILREEPTKLKKVKLSLIC